MPLTKWVSAKDAVWWCEGAKISAPIMISANTVCHQTLRPPMKPTSLRPKVTSRPSAAVAMT